MLTHEIIYTTKILFHPYIFFQTEKKVSIYLTYFQINQKKKFLTMAVYLDSRTVQYILRQFDAGVLPGQIFRALESSGGNFVSIDAIEECLRNNGREGVNYQATGGATPTSASHSSSNAYTGSQAYAPSPTTYAGQQGSTLHTGTRASIPYTPYDQQRHPGRTQASTNASSGSLRLPIPSQDIPTDQLITSAYHNGLTVRATVDRLMRMGRAATATEVVAFLNAHGLGSVRVMDYPPR